MWLIWTALAAPCSLDAPADSAFQVEFPNAKIEGHIIVEVDVDSKNLKWAQQLVAVPNAPLTLVVKPDLDPSVAKWLPGAVRSGHEVAVRLSTEQINGHPLKGPPALRKTLRPLKKAVGKVHAASAPAGSPNREAVLHRVGLKAILETNGPATGTPRTQKRMDGQIDNGVLLPRGPYAGACGDRYTAVPFTPPAADRVTQALYGTKAAPGSVVRVRIRPQTADDVEVFTRWVGILPTGRIETASDARRRFLALKRDVPRVGTTDATAGRLVPWSDVLQAADALPRTGELPAPTGPFDHTELFLGLAVGLAGNIEADQVRIQQIEGPIPAKSSLSKTVSVSRASVVDMATRLVADRPSTVPAGLAIEGQLFTASELLLLFADAARGIDPVVTGSVVPVDPSAPGLGWSR